MDSHFPPPFRKQRKGSRIWCYFFLFLLITFYPLSHLNFECGNISCLDCPRPFIQPDTNTAYTVVYQTELGCENTSTINVIVQNSCDENLIGLPQAFSPNGDGLNDIYYVRSTALELILNYRIYNQWGEEIFNAGNNFSPNDINTGWDGTYNGQPVNEGVYIYQVTASCPNGGNTIFLTQEE